eukprot:CAMPEP_0184459822 /NCGR_PEP_ID=MMETSP0740-20130409/38427_1 /TAXON_ID=385413 /ORGANISM="Thalassiosira miniscula, Strain CCMP1093" /LENGTH=41 /DNA_ID= /DNA_START= /DNA_END= /DNA_ORIENTATION=
MIWKWSLQRTKGFTFKLKNIQESGTKDMATMLVVNFVMSNT